MSRDELQRLHSHRGRRHSRPQHLRPLADNPASSKPIVPAGVREYFMKGDGGAAAAYRPVLYGAARIHYTDARRGIDVVRSLQAVVPFSEGADSR